MKISVLDIGATTLNLLTTTVEADGLRRRGDSSRFVRFGDGTLVSGFISAEAWASAIDGIGAMVGTAHARSSDHLIAVATSVVREASNGPAFRSALAQQYGLDVRVLSSRDEARLAFRGARSTFADVGRPLVVVDIGGGCINFAAGRGPRCELTSSLPLGTVRLAPAFAPCGSLSRRDAEALTALMRRSAVPLAAQLDELQPSTLAFSSGAARAVREHVTRHTPHPGPTGALSGAELATAQRRVVGSLAGDLVEAGVRPERAGSLAIAATLMRTIMELLAVDEALVVDRGLREGVALAHHDAVRAETSSGEPAAGQP